ncbi:MAG: nitrate reductase [Proteobacteria bacterium]|nr:nitrate reductase [Cystobacterineae bacterium]MCL2258242.1 nitrate reductase [Cystobacterineae bacterium]MCL2315403.1 nitrate reductase [Pseudomonadota bacterium]
MGESSNLDRREFLMGLAAIGGVGVLGAGSWGVLESMVPQAQAASWHKSVCRFCGNGCGVMVGMRDKKVVAIRGDFEATNKGFICVKGSLLSSLNTAGYGGNGTGRALKPKIRRGDQLVEVSWEEAMSLVAEKFATAIKTKGKNAVAFYGSGQLLTEETYTANKLFKGGIGTNNVDGNPRLCMASAAVGYTQVFGKDEPCGCYEDLDKAEVFFIIGANMAVAHQPSFERIKLTRKANPNCKIVVVDPRRCETAEVADLHLHIRPGYDLMLLNSMAYVIIKDNLANRDFVAKHCKFARMLPQLDAAGKPLLDEKGQALPPKEDNSLSLEEYGMLLEDYAPEKVAERIGISPHQIREVAHLFAKSKGTISCWTMGINQSSRGTASNNMLSALHLLTGQICKPGATPLSMTGQPNACGGVRDCGALSHLLPHGRLAANPKHREEVEEIWGLPKGTIAPGPGKHTIAMYRAMETGEIECLLVMCTNPAQSLPAGERYRRAMEKGFMVVAETFEDSETAKLADVILPAALWIEKEGVMGQTERRYQLVEKLLEPAGEARSDLQILVDLAERLDKAGVTTPGIIKSKTAREVWDEARKMSAKSVYNYEGMTWERMQKEHGIQWPCPTESHPGTARRYTRGDPMMSNPELEVEFYGQPDKRAKIWFRPWVNLPQEPSEQYPIILTTGRILEQWHTGTMTQRIKELNEAAGPATIEINVQDAHERNIQDGQLVTIESQFGKVQGKAKLSTGPRKGVCFAAFYDPSVFVNAVVSDAVDPMSFEPEFKVTAVSMSPAGDPVAPRS